MSFQPSLITPQQIYDAVSTDLPTDFFIQNIEAKDELFARIKATAKRRGMLSYSELVRGIKFDCPTISTEPFEITTYDWRGVDRKMMGCELALMTHRTILDTGCIISSVVVDSTQNAPSKTLFEWLCDLELLPNMEETTVLSFWIHQVKLTHEYFKTH